ncbi:hypothetical protein HGRIS_012325 [Hohenbuehelia grisea]|uniref:Uncharacterized protein n=1 Tax=Hohenbuehelia grisea TaxID=104357 RepID=A0ABR3IRX0_9AGAR
MPSTSSNAPRPFLLPPILLPDSVPNTARAFHEQAEFYLATVRALEDQTQVAWAAAYRNARMAEEHRRLNPDGFAKLQGVEGRVSISGLPISLPNDPDFHVWSYVNRLHSGEGRCWLETLDEASTDALLGDPKDLEADEADEEIDDGSAAE